jgi:serine-type D-Ala-D-Ala carboxypeptidase (penicillin-binding protein 5/6)
MLLVRNRTRIVGTAVVVAVAAVASLGTVRLVAAAPSLMPTAAVASPWVPAAGTPLSVAAPPQGSLAVDALVGAAATHVAAADAATVRPIASVAKTMTALVVLETHPLSPGEPGPVISMTQVDVDDYLRIASQDGSFVPVRVGEQFTERDLLLGLMLPSANNLALSVARWVDGSVAAFVARLNSGAAALGMRRTHFADPDGLDAATTSTAADLLRLGEAAVANPTLVDVVSRATATLPDGTVVSNLDRLLVLEPGWIGIKTGWTPQASGCLLFAARRQPAAGTPALTVVGATLGQPPDLTSGWAHPELGGAFDVARHAVETALAGYAAVRIGPGSIPVVGNLAAPWGPSTQLLMTGPDHVVLLRLGDTLTATASLRSVSVPAPPGTDAGSVTVSAGGTAVGRWSLITASAVDAPSAWWRLLHG